MGYIHKHFSPESGNLIIPINQEHNYLRLIEFRPIGHSVDEVLMSSTLLKYKASSKIHSNGSDGPIMSFKSLNPNSKKPGFYDLDYDDFGLDSGNYDCIEIILENIDLENLEIDLVYDTKNLFLPIFNPFADFLKFIGDRHNSKILFSAPFGQGKTTFLKFFFDPPQKDYEVFHLYPVNYPVAKNEDIFRYIKTEILFQLLGKDVTFDKTEIPYLNTLPDFLSKSAHRVLSPFLNMLPGVGGSIHKVYKQLMKLVNEYFVAHENEQIDDQKTAEEYLKEAYEKEGSIYEDNFYSQLIRELLRQLSAGGKHTVLVIDDLDRMDPDHIFRILNIFAAHFDQPESEENSNKFGFDKVIMVCDYHNLRHIYAHKYGPNTDHRGYLDKFFSKGIFEYNNKMAMASILDDIQENSIGLNSELIFEIYLFIVKDLIETNQLSLRELLRLKEVNYYFNKSNDVFYWHFPIFALCEVLDIDSLMIKINNCIHLSRFDRNKRKLYDQYMWYLIIPLVPKKCLNNKCILKYTHQNKELKFEINQNGYQAEKILLDSKKVDGIEKSNDTDKLFKGSDFYMILHDLARNYRENLTEINRMAGRD